MACVAVAVMALSGMLSACSNVGCTENQNSVPLAGLYSYNTGQAISIDSISIGGVGAPGDSLLAGPYGAVSSVYLPFRSTQSYTTFRITYNQRILAAAGVTDQITFYYDSTPWFASEDCGAMYHYRIKRVTHTYQLLDSVGVTDSLVTNIERQNIQLFFRTASADSGEGDDDV